VLTGPGREHPDPTSWPFTRRLWTVPPARTATETSSRKQAPTAPAAVACIPPQQRKPCSGSSHDHPWGTPYRSHAAKQLDAIGGIATASEAISYAVEGAGLLVGLVRGIVRDLIAQFVATLAARLPQWLAEEGLTLGIATPVVVGQVAALVAKWVNKIQHFVRALLNSLRRLSGKQDELTGVLDGLKQALRRLNRSDPAASTPKIPARPNTVLHSRSGALSNREILVQNVGLRQHGRNRPAICRVGRCGLPWGSGRGGGERGRRRISRLPRSGGQNRLARRSARTGCIPGRRDVDPDVGTRKRARAPASEWKRYDYDGTVGGMRRTRLRTASLRGGGEIAHDPVHRRKRAPHLEPPMGFVTGRLEGGDLRFGDEMTVTYGDARVASAVVRSIELHNAPGKTTIAVDADLADALRDGAVLIRS
jgi:hypothetical protein